MIDSNSKTKIKFADIILVVVIVLAAGFFFIYDSYFQTAGKWAEISVDGKLIKRVLLSKTENFPVEGPAGLSEIRIADNKIWIEEAPCPHKYCQTMGKINRSGQTIICIPNRLIIKIAGKGRDDIDAITE